jgi:Xaa-Pro aminopeptidase
MRELQEAVREEGLDGWLFCNFQHRDRLSDSILHLKPEHTNSRLWIYAVPAQGECLKLVHRVEAHILEGLPGTSRPYTGREELTAILKTLGGKRWGVHVSDTLPAISYLDAGTAGLLEQAGLILVSAASLVQRFKGLLDEEGMASHERAVGALYDIVDLAWNGVTEARRNKRSLREGEIRALIREEMAKRKLRTDHPPIVAAGANTGNPHYDFSGNGAPIREGDVIQLDLWAKEEAEASIYGDISWIGVFASSPPPAVEKAFDALIAAREGAWRFIETELSAGHRVSGAAVDRKAREILCGLGYGEALKHRTGHGIDTECHGSGVNMDSVEFPDPRLLLEGSCFSLEPGIYFSDFGLRTEIDVYISRGRPVVSGGNHARQFRILTC